MNGLRSDALVLFGASGDLARKKLLPAVHRLAAKGKLPGVPVVGVAASQWTDDRFRCEALAATKAAGAQVGDGVAEAVARSLMFVSGDYRDQSLYPRLADRLAGHPSPLFDLAIRPALFGDVVGGLAAAGLHHGARVVVEKPFGRDVASARALNQHLHAAFPETSIFRIDHFLGKEAVQNVLVLRFANSTFEPLWNRDHIACVQITMAEDFGVEGRGAFYDKVGTLRDVETYVAVRAEIDSWRWAGVPFFVRAGKALATTVTEAVVEFRAPSRPLFAGGECGDPPPNQLHLRVKPDDDITLRLQAKLPGGRLRSRSLDLRVSETNDDAGPEPYETLIDDAMNGDPGRFARQDGVEAAWRVVAPLLDRPGPVHRYEKGTWGPEAAGRLVSAHDGWRPCRETAS